MKPEKPSESSTDSTNETLRTTPTERRIVNQVSVLLKCLLKLCRPCRKANKNKD